VDKDGELAQGLPIKITIVGENKVGKSSFSIRFASKTFPSPEEHLPVAMEPIEGKGLHSGHDITYSLWDIRATHEYETLRVKSYFGTDVFLMMFSLVAPSSLKLIEEYWDAEVMAQIPDAIKILVGTKEDLVTDDDTLQKLADNHLHPVTHDEAMKVARKIGAAEYFTISSRMGTNVEQLMQSALHLASERMLKDMEPYDLDEDQKKRCAVM
jgi:small GTP-binding protein